MSIIDFPSGRQTFSFDCGPKALQLVLAYYGIDIREDKLIMRLKSDDLGTRPSDMKAVAESFGFRVNVHTECTVHHLTEFIDQKLPPIVLVQAWADRYLSLSAWRRTNEFGHYVIAIGYSENAVLFEDPATTGRSWLSKQEFNARWHDVDPTDGRLLNHFAMVLTGKQPAVRIPERMS